MDGTRTARLTPWVGRLLALNAAAFVLLATVFTAPRFFTALEFDPAAFTARPWTVFTYMFAHDGLAHFALTSLALFVFGPPVERRLGGRQFVAYYLYCGIGAALFTLGLAGVLRIEPFVGASGALFGVLLAGVVHRPDAELTAVPFPAPITVRAVLGTILALDVLVGLMVGTAGGSTGMAHFTHVGGAAAGYLFFRLQSLSTRRPPPRQPTLVRRPVVTPMHVQDSAAELRPAAPTPLDHGPTVEPGNEAEVDRVLDKISRSGMESLTLEERRFLADVAERKRNEAS